MIKLTCFTAAIVISASAAVALANDRDDNRRPRPGCHAVRAEIVDAPSDQDCGSPFNFCIAGEVHGNQGLNGTTLYELDGLGAAPATTPGMGESTGMLVYTLPHGTLTVRETGVGNMGAAAVSGVGASLEQVLSGTGRFEGVTGTLYLASTAADGQYTAIVSGDLCYP